MDPIRAYNIFYFYFFNMFLFSKNVSGKTLESLELLRQDHSDYSS